MLPGTQHLPQPALRKVASHQRWNLVKICTQLWKDIPSQKLLSGRETEERDKNPPGLTEASQHEPVVLVHVLLDELTALSEGSLALFIVYFFLPKVLIGILLAAHALWDVLHPPFAALLVSTISVGCKETDPGRQGKCIWLSISSSSTNSRATLVVKSGFKVLASLNFIQGATCKNAHLL